MKEFSVKAVRIALAQWGFKKDSRGDGSGHEVWRNHQSGTKVRPALRHKTVSLAALCSLGWQLEVQGICTKREFIDQIKSIF